MPVIKLDKENIGGHLTPLQRVIMRALNISKLISLFCHSVTRSVSEHEIYACAAVVVTVCVHDGRSVSDS